MFPSPSKIAVELAIELAIERLSSEHAYQPSAAGGLAATTNMGGLLRFPVTFVKRLGAFEQTSGADPLTRGAGDSTIAAPSYSVDR